MIFELEDVSKVYGSDEATVRALDHVTLQVPDGKLLVVIGPSGSGKSTLLNILGGMDTPTSGKVLFRGKNISVLTQREMTAFRRERIGFVFQFFNLMPNLTARENVELATEICPRALPIDDVMAQVGLAERSEHFPPQMSGGEQQRVAIARAVAKNPDVLLCDEPTGALDYTTGIKVLQLLHNINHQMAKTVIIITHNQPVAQIADQVIRMRSGKIVETYANEQPLDPEKVVW